MREQCGVVRALWAMILVNFIEDEEAAPPRSEGKKGQAVG